MSEVYLAHLSYGLDHENRQFAVKRLLPKLSENPLLAYLFEQEALLNSILHHPHIVTCHDFIKDNGDFFMIMEYIVGKEVGAIGKSIEDKELSERIKIAVAVGIGAVRALCYLHAKTDSQGKNLHLVHADVSPQNIMVTTNGVVKLYDFGAFNNELVDKEIVRGTIRYMSLEQASGEKLDARSDIFSLSLVMLEMVLGNVVVPDNKRTMSFELAIAEGLSAYKPLRDFFTRGLAAPIEQRFSSSDEMLKSLEKIAQDLLIVSPQSLLEDTLATLAPGRERQSLSKKRRADDRKPIIYFSLLVIGIFFAMGFVVSVFSKIFSPKYQHNIPYWSEAALLEAPIPQAINTHVEHRVVKKTGSLLFRVEPWAEVFIDGNYVGKTPMPTLNLPAGQYVIQLKNPNISAIALKVVTIYADKKTEVSHSFHKKDEQWR